MKQQDILQRLFTFEGDEANDYFCVDTVCDRNLNVRGIYYVRVGPDGKLPPDWQHRFRYTSNLSLARPYEEGDGTLCGPYAPANSLPTLETIVPDNMDEETREALANLRGAIGGDVEGFVCAKLRMGPDELARSLKAEQVDSVALAIYNIEARKQGIVIGDQTGVGKGRQAAAIIRYALRQGYTPVFITARANLFSDIYRDCKALGIADARPIIFNSGATVVDTTRTKADYEEPVQGDDETDADFDKRLMKAQAHAYEVVYTGDGAQDFETPGALPDGYDYVMATYSQFNARKSPKKEWLMELAARSRCVFILDEAHMAAGAHSNTGEYFRDLLTQAAGAVFLSATFAKRADNMGIYATKTLLGQCGMSGDELMAVLAKGGAPLQEVLASNLVRAGQMVRRERSMQNVVVRYITLDERGNKEFGVPNSSEQDRANSDAVMSRMRRLMTLHKSVEQHMSRLCDTERKRIADAARDAAKELGYMRFLAETASPLDSLFALTESLLLSTKAESVARRAAQHVAEGRKVVICVAKTKESAYGRPLNDDGDMIDGSLKSMLLDIYRRALTARIVVETEDKAAADFLQLHGYALARTSPKGGKGMYRLQRAADLSREAATLFTGPEGAEATRAEIEALSNPLPLSPIDYMRHVLEAEGVRVGECTGRTTRLRYDDGDVTRATVEAKPKSDVTATYARFQNNEIDVMFINQAGATGASCHAVPTDKVPAQEVKQRVMIIAQPELDVTQEMQKRGRINRTGQLPNLPPVYEYISTSIPAERRMLMMLKRKLKSLDANTSSDQRQNDTMLDTPDFFNRYGDEAARNWLSNNGKECEKMGLPRIYGDAQADGLARTATARAALLNCKEQDKFYSDILDSYAYRVEEAKDSGVYNLECEYKNLKATCVSQQVVGLGNRSNNFFGGASILRKYAYQVEAGHTFATAHGHFARNREKIEKWLNEAPTKVSKDRNYGFFCSLVDKCLDDLRKGIPPMFVLTADCFTQARSERGRNAIAILTDAFDGRTSLGYEFPCFHFDITDRHYNCEVFIDGWRAQELGRTHKTFGTLDECAACWEEGRKANSPRDFEVVEGNLITPLLKALETDMPTTVWKFSTDKGKIVTGVHTHVRGIDILEDEDPEQLDHEDPTLWPRLEWDPTQIPKSRKPLELSNDAKEAKQKNERMDNVTEVSRKVLEAAKALPRRMSNARRRCRVLIKNQRKRGGRNLPSSLVSVREIMLPPCHIFHGGTDVDINEFNIEESMHDKLFKVDSYDKWQKMAQTITEKNFDKIFWSDIFTKSLDLGIRRDDLYYTIFDAFQNPDYTEAQRNFVEAANLVRDAEGGLRAEIEAAQRTATATEETKTTEENDITRWSRKVLKSARALPDTIAYLRQVSGNYDKIPGRQRTLPDTIPPQLEQEMQESEWRETYDNIDEYLYDVFFSFLGDNTTQETESNFDVPSWSLTFSALTGEHRKSASDFLDEAFSNPGHTEAKRNFVEAANLVRDAEANFRAQVEAAQRTATATEETKATKAAKKRGAAAKAPRGEATTAKAKPKAPKPKAEAKARTKRQEAELVTSADSLHNILARYAALDGKTINDATVRGALGILQQVQKAIFSRRVRKGTEVGELFYRAQTNLMKLADPAHSGKVIEIGDKDAFARYARKEKTADPTAKRLALRFIKIATKPRGAVSDTDLEELKRIRDYKPAAALKEWEVMRKAISGFLVGDRKVLAYPQELSGLEGLAGV